MLVFCFCDAVIDSATETDDDFPTPELLREANAAYKQTKIAKDEKGRVVPSPAVRTKQQIFRLSDYKAIDNKACQVRILKFLTIVMPNTHRRRRRDETVLSRRRRRCEHNSQLAHDDCRRIRSSI